LYHLIQSFVALLDQRIVLLDLAILGLHIQLDSLPFALQLHDLLVELARLHTLLHDVLVDLVAPIAKLLNFSFKLVEIVVIRHSVSLRQFKLFYIITSSY
jgi:hypothetical protein